MIDYTKILVNGANISELKKNKYLDFYTEVNPDTGEIKNNAKKDTETNERNIDGNPKEKKDGRNNRKEPSYHEKATYKGLTFLIYASGSVFIKGSLHKYWNDGKHNYNDFSQDAFFAVLNDIQKKFNINAHQMILKCIELGVNIRPPRVTDEIMDHCFLHSTAVFKWCKVENNGSYIEVTHQQYLIKIYNKAKQYRARGFDIKDEILRFEIKYLKLEKLKCLGIVTMQDLIDHDLGRFVSKLVDEWKRVLFYDFTIKSNSKSLPNYKNPLYWRGLTKRKSKASLKKHRLKLSKLTKENSENIALQVLKLIELKGRDLTRGVGIVQQIKADNVHKGIHIDQDQDEAKKGRGIHIDPLVILSISIPNEKADRLCMVTGVPMRNQKEKSMMLSHTGLYFYPKCNPEIFAMLKRKYHIECWSESEMEKHEGENAHDIGITECKSRRYSDDNNRLLHIYENCMIRFLEVVKTWCIRLGSYIGFRFE